MSVSDEASFRPNILRCDKWTLNWQRERLNWTSTVSEVKQYKFGITGERLNFGAFSLFLEVDECMLCTTYVVFLLLLFCLFALCYAVTLRQSRASQQQAAILWSTVRLFLYLFCLTRICLFLTNSTSYFFWILWFLSLFRFRFFFLAAFVVLYFLYYSSTWGTYYVLVLQRL